MNSTIRCAALALAAGFFAVTACEKSSHTNIATIIDRHTEARGGAAALAAVNAIEVRRSVQEGKRQLITHYVAMRDGRMRLDVFEAGRPVFAEGFDGQSGWQVQELQDHVAEMPDWALGAVRRTVRYNLFSLNELAATGTKLTLADREKLSGILYWVIEATDADGYKQRLFVDPVSFLITHVQERGSVHPDRSSYRYDIDTYYGDFRRIDGVIFSFQSEVLSSESGMPEQKTNALEIIVNPKIDATAFLKPAAKQD